MKIRRGADPEYAAVYAMARRWRDTSMATGESLFDPQLQTWTQAAADELHRRFIEQADEGSRSFNEKLADQMQGASQEATSLMAELMFIHLLPLSNVTGEHKTKAPVRARPRRQDQDEAGHHLVEVRPMRGRCRRQVQTH